MLLYLDKSLFLRWTGVDIPRYQSVKMRIKGFSKLVEEELSPHVLHNTALVVDGQNLFYDSYKRAGLSNACGIKADCYASELRKYLDMFKKANVRCYFLFKGGHKDMEKRIKKNKDDKIVPILMKETYKQVLDEMNFEYVVCEYESKKDIVEVAQRLNCPIMAFDIEYCFSGLQYIPSNKLKFQEGDNVINCDCFFLETFLKKHKLTEDKLALFIVLTDENIFPEGFFRSLFKHLYVPRGNPVDGYWHLFRWLSKKRKEQIYNTIFKFISIADKKKFVEEESKARLLIARRESGELGAACLLDPEAAHIARADPSWFAKGVAQRHVAIDYLNLYRSKTFLGAPRIPGFEHENATLATLEIIKYVYDLLTNFENDGFTFYYDTDEGKESVHVADTHSIRKPAYEAVECVFENGWGSVLGLGLMEHFVRSTLQPASPERVERAPAPARLLLLALAYCARRRPDMPRALPAVALLVHVALDLVHDKADKNNLPKFPFDKKPILDSNTDKNDVTVEDCNVAAAILKDYFHSAARDPAHTLDRSLLHSLAQYQVVVLQLMNLNALCGAAWRAPALARSYNGTLAYRLLRAAERAADPVAFLDDLLSPAPTVYAYINGLLEVYEDIL